MGRTEVSSVLISNVLEIYTGQGYEVCEECTSAAMMGGGGADSKMENLLSLWESS
jgi:hypothetical protein